MNKDLQLENSSKKIEQGNLIYVLNDIKKTASIFHGKSVKGDLFIPRSIKYESQEYVIVSILKNAFEYSSIKSIQFPTNSEVRSLGKDVFYYSKIESISLPSSLIDLQEGWCTCIENLKKINISTDNPYYKTHEDKFIIGKSSIEEKDYDTLIFCFRNIKTVKVPCFIKHIGPYAFEGCKFQHIEFSADSKLQTIGNNAFYNSLIDSFTFPLHLKKIGEHAFHSCKQIRNFEIPMNSELETIEKCAFCESSIETLTISSKIVDLKEGWCISTKSLKQIIVSPSNPRYSSINGKIIIGKSSINQDNYDVLVFCVRDIETVTIPCFIKHIGAYSFEKCSKLQHVELSDDSQLQTIQQYAFKNTEIKTFLFPPKLIHIGKGAFEECEFLKNVEIPTNSELKIIDDRAFNRCRRLRLIDIPANSMITTFGRAAFYFTPIKRIKIPSSLIKIERFAFANCYRLNRIDFEPGSEIKTISSNAFSYAFIKSISIPSSITQIDNYAFMNCMELQIIAFDENSNINSINENIFIGCKSALILIPIKINIVFQRKENK